MITGWSQEIVFSAEAVRQNVPSSSGIYEIIQSTEYPRYRGKTRILKFGCSRSDLQAELLNHLRRHTAANRLARIQRSPGITLSFKYAILGPEVVQDDEKALLRSFEDEHWDLPLLNSTRGYDRDEDRHYRED